jgi:hypothetical protein
VKREVKRKKSKRKRNGKKRRRDRVAANFHLADVTLPLWRVPSDWLKLHCRGGGYLLDAWGVNEQGFGWASEGPNFIV